MTTFSRVAVLCGALALPALAATPEAWTEHKKAVLAACMKASGLEQPRPVGKLIEYPDRLSLTAILLRGRYPQPHMEGRMGQELCLYDRRSRTAFVSEADSILLKP
ncbi:hypothetical protein [Pseudomonas indica]|uniref:Uncharacterized protein n=1 Tax=Pseudomonas indica TaxID=137658 RepID=A0A1G9PTW5_9PSED|nr:hypothetical protein [Pseudomonas indica]SDM01921.1 hypothetical protein SAMN05216186_1416 [Pseudomonas indica]